MYSLRGIFVTAKVHGFHAFYPIKTNVIRYTQNGMSEWLLAHGNNNILAPKKIRKLFHFLLNQVSYIKKCRVLHEVYLKFFSAHSRISFLCHISRFFYHAVCLHCTLV